MDQTEIIIELLKKIIKKQDEALTLMNNGRPPKPITEEERAKYIAYINSRLSDDQH